jgi:hypothetical protein
LVSPIMACVVSIRFDHVGPGFNEQRRAKLPRAAALKITKTLLPQGAARKSYAPRERPDQNIVTDLVAIENIVRIMQSGRRLTLHRSPLARPQEREEVP